jgi:hypothetical protein
LPEVQEPESLAADGTEAKNGNDKQLVRITNLDDNNKQTNL